MNQDQDEFAQRLMSIINTAIDGIITIDVKGTVEMINPSAAVLFGYDPNEVIGQNIKMLMPSPYHEEHDGYLHRYHTTKVRNIIDVGREVSGQTKSGDVFPMRLAVSEVILNDRIIYTGIIHDLSKVKMAQNKIVALNKQLEEKVEERTYDLEKVVNKLLTINTDLKREVRDRLSAEKKLNITQVELREALENEKDLNELKSRFVSMASHEFRTPLTTILSSALLISKYTKEDQQPKREKHVNRIKSAVVNLTGILNDFLSLSKLEEGAIRVDLQPFNLKDLCLEVADEIKGLVKKDQKIIHVLHGDHHEFITDRGILKNILFNLVSNAIKYSDDNIHCDIVFHPDYITIAIKDSGIGIPQEDQKHMFTRFFRAQNVTNIQGTGLGLNIVKRYIELLNGTITFESEHEKGTTFTVTLPYNSKDNK